MALSLDDKANIVLRRAVEVVEGHGDLYPSADNRLRGVLAGTLTGVAFATVVRANGWLFGLRVLFGAIVVAIKYPWLGDTAPPQTQTKAEGVEG